MAIWKAGQGFRVWPCNRYTNDRGRGLKVLAAKKWCVVT